MRALLFDICDTLVRTAGVEALLRLPGRRCRAGDVARFFAESDAFRAYECGRLDSRAFLAALRAALDVDVDGAELGRAYEALVVGEIEGVAAWVRRLAEQYPLYALSNNNPLLWRGTRRVCTVLDCFSGIFLSHEIGLLKPDARAFEYALAQMGCRPGEVVLVDDNPRCVQAARALGMGAVRFVDVPGAARQLRAVAKNLA